MLQVRQLSKAYGSLVVSNKIDLHVLPGQRHIIIGPNGAGKSTLVGQLGGQIRSDSGQIVLAAQDVTDLPPYARARSGLGRTFQKNTLFQSLSVFENVRLGVQAAHGSSLDLLTDTDRQPEILRQTEAVVEQMHLGPVARRTVRTLSYGDLRQIEVAVALSTNPKILMMDEPTSGLSPAETQQMIGVIQALPRTISILMIEHDMDVVFSTADHITVLYYGEVIASGLPRAVAADARVQEVYLGASH